MTCTSGTGLVLIAALWLAVSSGVHAQTAPAPGARLGLTSGAAPGQDAAETQTGESATDVAKKLQNPVGDLISLPFTNYTNFNVRPNKGTQDILHIQPVVPIHVNEDWNVITRTVFVSAMGMGLIFHGVVEAFQIYGIATGH